jgi:hypothetical protein
MTATEGPAKALELPDREKLKGLEGPAKALELPDREKLEGPELERSAMVGRSEAAAAPKGGGADRVWGSWRRRLGWARVRIGF